jgi:hypothetical protein
MNNGLKIILARMDTNPEEFQDYPNSRWRELIDSHWDIFLDEERDEYQAKLRVILVDKFSELVVKELMDDEPETMRYKASDRYAISGTEAALSRKLNISLGDYAKIKKDMEKIK